MHNYLSIDIGGTYLKYALINGAGTITLSDKIDSAKNLEEFTAAIDAIITKHKDNIRAVTFSCPGKIDSKAGIIYLGGALPYLHEFAIKKYVEDSFDLPCSVINDGKAAALAELWLGQLKDVQNGAAMTLGTGVGGGIIIDGKLHEGSSFQAGELSYMMLDTDESLGISIFGGSKGSAVRFVHAAATALELDDVFDGQTVFEHLEAGSPVVQPIFEQYCRDVAIMIFNVQVVIDFSRIAIGGGVSVQPMLVEEISKQYNLLIDKMPGLARAEIVACTFRNEAGLLGALYNYFLDVETAKI